MMNNIKSNAGVTITALLVIIIILVILAGVTITSVMSSDGIITKAKTSTSAYKKEFIREKLEIKLADLNFNKISTDGNKLTLNDLYDLEDDEITAVKVSDDIALVYIDEYQCEIDKDFSIISINPKQTESTIKKVKPKLTFCTIER